MQYVSQKVVVLTSTQFNAGTALAISLCPPDKMNFFNDFGDKLSMYTAIEKFSDKIYN